MKQNIYLKKLINCTVTLLVLLPAATLAELGDGALTENKGTLQGFLTSIQNWLLGFVGALAVLFIVYGGFLYMTSGGNKPQIETAKKTLTYAIGGLAVVLLAGVVLQLLTGNFLTSIFGSKAL